MHFTGDKYRIIIIIVIIIIIIVIIIHIIISKYTSVYLPVS